MSPINQNYGFATKAIHAGSAADAVTGAVIPAISLSTTFAQSAPAVPLGVYEYSRSDNPNRNNLETCIAALENGKHCLATSSGSASTALILHSLTKGDHVISIGDVYGGTHRYFTKVANTHGVETSFTNDLFNEFDSLVRPETRLVWIETPSNPTLSVTDIAKVAELVKAVRATGQVIHLVVDNTFLSPYISNPLTLGADIVVHSATKYINGHSDVVLGLIIVNSDELAAKFRFLQNAIGCIPSPFDSWLAHRGVKTLHLRVERASTSALKIARALEKNDKVISVNYPGLESHANHKVTLTQHRNGLGGGMISFRLKGGVAAVNAFSSAAKIFTLAESLGGIESLLEVPAQMTHAGIPQEAREASGVYDDLVRLSVGIEDADDLLKDVEQALDIATAL
ncbi:hypothetical protein BABINDRAFT_66292 [Babjeviella inositovora NRRL Y-12698]|uniref:cystathionine gamma-lyase n=1 Tax=Babjeviella inositovora NRRL Y-12698 TaxID=984486 RepID=A0A1E3QJ57_9ASCO|nr:uncharacterized protein BABINDRAFT_66292 [Babjeviella inositovora NRRL Y-12698]ODQ77753.1 hypothetical protein BABINDRAFT_66292 [Babjeviella inositovora NRRL Y-12698]